MIIGARIFISSFELKIWIIHTKNKSKNIPKSGCLRRINPIKIKIKILIIKEKSFLVLNLDNKSELTIIKLGLMLLKQKYMLWQHSSFLCYFGWDSAGRKK